MASIPPNSQDDGELEATFIDRAYRAAGGGTARMVATTQAQEQRGLLQGWTI
jgi:hypothetical protein